LNESLLRPLIDRYGWPRVSEVGMRVLGYPPLMVHTVQEVLLIEEGMRE